MKSGKRGEGKRGEGKRIGESKGRMKSASSFHMATYEAQR